MTGKSGVRMALAGLISARFVIFPTSIPACAGMTAKTGKAGFPAFPEVTCGSINACSTSRNPS
jgi:hypothetical protein